MNWTSVAPAVTTAFVSSLVEAVEALTIVLAVASVRGWPVPLLVLHFSSSLCLRVLPDMPLAAGAVLLIGCLGVLSPIS